jgi:hypothetical protein
MYVQQQFVQPLHSATTQRHLDVQHAPELPIAAEREAPAAGSAALLQRLQP